MKKKLLLFTAAAAMLAVVPRVGAQTSTLDDADMPHVFSFEEGSDWEDYWQFSNQTNGWYVGSAISNVGEQALYVSNDQGVSNAYTISGAASRSYAWFDVSISTAGIYEMQFDYNIKGETGYDYLEVYYAPTTTTPTSGSPLSGATQLGSRMQNQNGWQQFYQSINIDNSQLGDYRIIFMWLNDGSVGTNPPAAIDNIYIGRLTCPSPVGPTFSYIAGTEVTASWSPLGEESQWVILVDGEEWGTVDDTTWTITGLAPNTPYTISIKADCGGDGQSLPVSAQVRTACEGYASLPFTSGFEDLQTGDMPPCWLQVATGTNTGLYPNPVFPSAYRHTPNAHNSDVYFEFESNLGETEILALPLMENISNLQLSFYASIVNNNFMLEAGVIEEDEDGNFVFVPVDTVDLIPGSSFASAYRIYNVLFNSYDGPGERLAIRATPNSTATYTLMIDDFSVIYAGEPVLGPLQGSYITAVDSSVTIEATLMTGGDATYTWSSQMADAGDATIANNGDASATITYTATGIDTVMVIVDNDFGYDTAWTVVYVLDPSPISQFPYQTGFEPGEDISWHYSNNASGWYIGNAVSLDGTRSLYVSSDNGNTNFYSTQASAYSYAYRHLHFDEAGEYTVSFDWRCAGGSDAYMAASLAEGLTDPTAGSYNFGTSFTSSLYGQTTWQTAANVITVQPGDYTLIFRWYNGYQATGSQPPAAVDNIVISANSCPAVANLTANDVAGHEATLIWDAIGEETEWLVSIDNGEYVTVSDASFSITGLDAQSQHTATVRALCADGDTSFARTVNFTTTIACPTVSNVAASDITSDGATLSWTAVGSPTAYVYSLDGSTWQSTTDASATLTGLEPLTAYTFYVRVVCNDDDTSATVSTTFTTACADGGCDIVFQMTDSYGDGWTTTAILVIQEGVEVGRAALQSGSVGTATISVCSSSSMSLVFVRGNYPDEIGGAVLTSAGDTMYVIESMGDHTDNDTLFSVDSPCDFTPGENPGEQCNAPVITTTIASENAIALSWSGSATAYEVGIASGSTWNAPASPISVSALSYTFSNLAAATTYTVGVRAVCGTDHSDWVFTTATTDNEPEQPCNCEAPSELHTTATTASTATLDWTPGSENTSWEIELDGANIISTNSHPYTITDLAAGSAHSVRIRAICCDNVRSDWSQTINFATDNPTGIDGTSMQQLAISPNPATDVVSLYGIEVGADISIVDQSGRTLLRTVAHETMVKIDIADLPAGAYYVRVSSATNVAIGRLIVR